MPKCDDLLQRAKDAPKGLRFSEATRLVECAGYELARRKGSHTIFKHPALRLPNPSATINLQDRKGYAKPYQIRQIVSAIEAIAELDPDSASGAFPEHFPKPDPLSQG